MLLHQQIRHEVPWDWRWLYFRHRCQHSERLPLIPIMFTAFDSKSKLRNYNTFCRASAITLQDLEDFELSICTTVMLSVLDCIRIERNCSDQRKQAKAIGINYKELISVATHI